MPTGILLESDISRVMKFKKYALAEGAVLRSCSNCAVAVEELRGEVPDFLLVDCTDHSLDAPSKNSAFRKRIQRMKFAMQ
jgi:hypothetical protein